MSDPIPKDGYVLIIGAMKCGTSSLYSYLSEHPKICPACAKEPEFFSEYQSHGVKVDDYTDLWAFDTSVHRYALEASTGYTKYPTESNVARNIFKFGIDPKFIYIIRNPFERITSHFSFQQIDSEWNLDIDDDHLIYASNYFLQLEQYRKFFSMDNILLLDFDDLVQVPQETLTKVYNFLGILSDCFPTRYEVKNATESQSQLQRRIRSSRFGRWLGYVPSPIRQLGKRALPHSSTTKQQLTAAQHEYVYNALSADMAQLQQVYGFDVRKWGFEASVSA